MEFSIKLITTISAQDTMDTFVNRACPLLKWKITWNYIKISFLKRYNINNIFLLYFHISYLRIICVYCEPAWKPSSAKVNKSLSDPLSALNRLLPVQGFMSYDRTHKHINKDYNFKTTFFSFSSFLRYHPSLFSFPPLNFTLHLPPPLLILPSLKLCPTPPSFPSHPSIP